MDNEMDNELVTVSKAELVYLICGAAAIPTKDELIQRFSTIINNLDEDMKSRIQKAADTLSEL